MATSLFLTACHRESAAPKPVTMEQAVPAMENAFQKAPPPVKEEAREALAAMQRNDDPGAFIRLQGLTASPQLTPEQRDAAFKSWIVVNIRLQAAASNGNAAAQGLLDRYHATK